MKKLISIILTVSLASCFSLKPIDYEELNDIDDLNSQVIDNFYKKVLDTIFQNHRIENEPIKTLEVIPNELCVSLINTDYDLLDSFDFFDESFVNKQLDKFNAFQWKKVLSKHTILPPKIEKSFREDVDEGWTKFKNDGNKGCICCLSVPIFSKDFKKVFVEVSFQCAPLTGYGEILVFKWKNNKWTLFQKCPTWMS
ncbi:MAG: hypothetical protein JXQ87_17865 [Bacteroidia bacterium]